LGRDRNRVCPVEFAHSLDSRLRRWLQNPRRILAPFVADGMTVLDVGCGPGFFSIEMALMVGPTGRVIAADLQDGMLQKLREKIRGTDLAPRMTLVRCERNSVGVRGPVDFILAFFMVHEVPDKDRLFWEFKAVLRPGGRCLLVEPKLFHVSRGAFEATLGVARKKGFAAGEGPKLRFCWSAVLTHI